MIMQANEDEVCDFKHTHLRFGVKKCMFLMKKSIAPYTDPFHAYRFSLFKKKSNIRFNFKGWSLGCLSSTKFVFFGPIRNTRWRPGLWLAETFWTSPLKPLNGIQLNLTGSKIPTSSTKFMFLVPIIKTRYHPGLWLAETFLTSPLKPLNGIQWNFLTGSKIPTSSTMFVLFGPISKHKLTPWSIPQKGGTLYSGAL